MAAPLARHAREDTDVVLRHGIVLFGEDGVDEVGDLLKEGRLPVARVRHVDREDGANVARVPAQHDDAIGQADSLLDAVGDDEDAGGGDVAGLPDLPSYASNTAISLPRNYRSVQEWHCFHSFTRKNAANFHSATLSVFPLAVR